MIFAKNLTKKSKNSIKAPDGRKHRRRKGLMSDAEIMTILICFHFNTFRNFKHYYLFYVQKHMRHLIPEQLSYNRFVEVESKVSVQMMLFLQLFCFGECTGISFVDSTCVPVCHNKRIRNNKVFKDYAEIGKSTMGWYYGFKLHLICNEKENCSTSCLLEQMWTTATRMYLTDWQTMYSGNSTRTRDTYHKPYLTGSFSRIEYRYRIQKQYEEQTDVIIRQVDVTQEVGHRDNK